jgi:hypothetical protein
MLISSPTRETRHSRRARRSWSRGEREPGPLKDIVDRVEVPVLLVASGAAGELAFNRAYRRGIGQRASLHVSLRTRFERIDARASGHVQVEDEHVRPVTAHGLERRQDVALGVEPQASWRPPLREIRKTIRMLPRRIQ